ncbi:hypothetical protein [Stutzerimonas stutzeri]|uniref:hypothetical protein n=1 Tax=Stutzerimonas stutzeri TaxID=316 RepID=UPI0002F14E23|nr:hypothetical protein [Stutzerimonas stutzeri]
MGNAEFISRLLNVGLRGSTLVSKFLLIIMLAKYLQPSSLGMYGLLVVSIAYSMYPLGFEFYTFSSRELVRADIKDRAQKLKNQVSMHAVLYFFVMPLLLLVFYFEFIPWRLAPLFLILVVLEHLNQEAMRLLTALQYQLVSSVALFLRQGLWALVLVLLMYFYPSLRKLEYLLTAWAVGSFFALCLSVYVLVKMSAIKNNAIKKTEWHWVLRGIKIALPLFAASLSVNFITTADRYWLAILQGDTILGAYVFYMALVTAMITFMDAGIFSFIYPRLLVCSAEDDREGFSKLIKGMFIQVSLVSAFFVLFIVFFADWFFTLLGEAVYSENIGVFYVLVFMVIIQAFGYIPHYGLYAQSCDKQIVVSSIVSVPLFIVSVLILSQYNVRYAIPVALCFVYAFVLIYKLYAYYLVSKRVVL